MPELQEVKDALGIKNDNKDEQILAILPQVESFVKGYCNITEIPPEYDRNIVKMVEYDLNRKAGIQSESLSRHSVSYATDYPPDVLKGLRRKIRW